LWIFVFCIFAALTSLLAILFSGQVKHVVLFTSALILIYAFLYTGWHVLKVAIRFAYFVDSVHPRTFALWRSAKDLYRHWVGSPTYEHDPEGLPADLLDKIGESLRIAAPQQLETRTHAQPVSAAIALEHHGQANKILADLAKIFMSEGHWVQYTAFSRHPYEFIAYLSTQYEGTQRGWAEHIIAVDAYTRHFGFADSIYLHKARKLREIGVESITAAVTYAGVHTASSRAFNRIKAKASGTFRPPVLVIYEDSFALADLESEQQYRVFVRHVLPSERLWGGMFTVFVETAQPKAEWELLQAYAGLRVDLRARTT
jgi:hypothetical protein